MKRPYTLAAELEEWRGLLSSAIDFRQSLPEASPEAGEADKRIAHYQRMINNVSQEIEDGRHASSTKD